MEAGFATSEVVSGQLVVKQYSRMENFIGDISMIDNVLV